MTRFILVRHGETLWNREQRIQGQSDSELSAAGMRQARAVAARLAGAGAGHLVASDLGRTMKTAAPVASATGLTVEPHAGLRERSFGMFEGLTPGEIEQAWPVQFERWRSRDASYSMPGGESLMQLRERVKATLESIAGRANGCVIIVTHGGFLDAAYRIARGISAEVRRDWPLPNASINTIEIGAQGWKICDWAVVDHLDDAMDDQD